MKFAIVSDSHDRWDLLEQAVARANEAGCEVLLHAGDLVEPEGVAVLAKFIGDVFFVWGNNEPNHDFVEIITKKIAEHERIHLADGTLDKSIAGVRIFMNHYPEVAQAAYGLGIHDLVIHGHNHEYHVEQNNGRFLINPGELCGRKTGIPTFVIFDSVDKSVERIELAL
ncbi:MAG: YfcE family phosphodiesterase [bacterium]|nr:YfcE family phosphodiesterase [bacterium]